MNIMISDKLVGLAQIAFYVISPTITFFAVLVAYLALAKQSKPHILVHYRPNTNVQSIIDLVIENIGSGMARKVKFSVPIPVSYYGIEKSSQKGFDILQDGLPALAVGQQLVYDGGQYGGLSERLGKKLEVVVSYKYKNPLGMTRKRSEICVLSVSHLRRMTTRGSAEQAIVDALKGPNKTTLQRIEKCIDRIGSSLEKLSKERDDTENSGHA